MRRLIPYRALRFVVPAAPDDVVSRLRERVSDTSVFFPRDAGEPFRGRVDAQGFKIQHQIRYKSSFLPVIVGRIAPTPAGSEVGVVMRLNHFVALFMVVFFGGLLADAIRKLVFTNTSPGPALLIMAVLLLAVFLLLLTFKSEADRAERLLTELFARP